MLAGWFVGWLAGWLVGWLAGWLVVVVVVVVVVGGGVAVADTAVVVCEREGAVVVEVIEVGCYRSFWLCCQPHTRFLVCTRLQWYGVN